MSSPQRPATGATAAEPRRRRPLWAWLLLALVIIAIVIAILLLTGRCGSGDPAAPPAGSPTAAPAAAPGPAPGAAPGPAPGPAPGAVPPGAPGAPVDTAALQSRIDAIVAAEPVTFLPNRAELTDSGAQGLERVAEVLADAPSARVVVTGYAAPAGASPTPDPQQLSDQRAALVAEELAQAGVAADRIQTRGASDTNPRPDLATSRRAEISVS